MTVVDSRAGERVTIDFLPQWADELAAAFHQSGPDVVERSVSGARGFLVERALIALVDPKAGARKVRVRVGGEQRRQLEARAHFDRSAAIPTLIVVTEDKEFAQSLAPPAYRYARAAEPQQPEVRRAAAPRRRRAR